MHYVYGAYLGFNAPYVDLVTSLTLKWGPYYPLYFLKASQFEDGRRLMVIMTEVIRRCLLPFNKVKRHSKI